MLERELGRYGIRLNTVSCGPVAEVGAFVVDRVGDAGARVLSKLDKRRMFPVAGLDLARTLGFMLADTGDNITGQTWSVNGGLSIVG